VAVQAGGTPVGSNATPRLAFAAAGADFLVEKRPLAYGVPLPADDSPEGEDLFTFTDSRPLSQHRAIVRPDTGACLGVVGSGYTPVQNESLIDLFDYLREDAQLENIVVLEHGRKIFATASIDIQGDVTSGDTVRRYLHAFNSHDGSSAFGVFFSDMRLVCANQLRFIAGRGARRAASEGAGLVMRHTKSVEQFAKSLPRLIDLETARFHKDLQELRALTTSTLTTEAAKAILEATFADKLATPIKDKQLGEMRPATWVTSTPRSPRSAATPTAPQASASTPPSARSTTSSRRSPSLRPTTRAAPRTRSAGPAPAWSPCGAA
jgi:hypothetical protein